MANASDAVQAMKSSAASYTRNKLIMHQDLIKKEKKFNDVRKQNLTRTAGFMYHFMVQ
jgi:hypothetical protein